jgi:hypothetical protein
MQKPPIWFLAGTFGTSVRRKCNVPSTSAIFFPIIEKECSYAEEGHQLKSEADLIARATHLMNLVSYMDVEVDGYHLPNLWDYRARSRVFDLIYPADNVYGVNAGVTRSVTDGYWLLIKPLLPGIHYIHFKAEASVPAGPISDIAKRYVNLQNNSFSTEVFYQLDVYN